jgi:hypothetical protein
MLKAIFGYQMKMTVNLTVRMLLAEETSIGDNGLQVLLMIEWASPPETVVQ